MSIEDRHDFDPDQPLDGLESTQSDALEDSPSLMQVQSALSRMSQPGSGRNQALHRFDDYSLGRYQIQKLLGCRGPSTVLLAWDPILERHVVLKVFERGENSGDEIRFLKEARALAQVRHPRVATCYGIEETDAAIILVMEFVPGVSLHELLNSSVVSLDRALEITRQITEGIVAVHAAGLLHRDLKPSNVMVVEDGNVKLIDFGLAEAPSGLAADDCSGTPAYMAPEVARGQMQQVDMRSDVFGLGAILYDMLTGQPPFCGNDSSSPREQACIGRIVSPDALHPGLPKAVHKLCLGCLATHAEDRFASASEFLHELTGYQRRRRYARLVFGGVVGVLMLAVVGWATFSVADVLQERGLRRAVSIFQVDQQRMEELAKSADAAVARNDWMEAAQHLRLANTIAAKPNLQMAYQSEYAWRLEEAQRILRLAPDQQSRIAQACRVVQQLFEFVRSASSRERAEIDEWTRRGEKTAGELAELVGDDAFCFLNCRAALTSLSMRSDPAGMLRHAQFVSRGYDRQLGPAAARTLRAKRVLAGALRETGSHADANVVLDAAVRHARQLPTPAQTLAIELLEIQAMTLAGLTDRAKGEAAFLEAAQLHERLFGPDAPQEPSSHFRAARYHRFRRELEAMTQRAQAPPTSR